MGGDDHPLDHRMGVALQDHTVHKGAGVAFIGVANEILRPFLYLVADPPFPGSRKSGAPPATQPCLLYLLDNRHRIHLQGLVQGEISSPGQVVLDIQGIDVAAVPEDQPLFDLETRHLGDIRGAVLLELHRAQGELKTGIVAEDKTLHQALDLLMGDRAVQDGGETGAGVVDDDQGLGKKKANTSYLADMGLNTFLLYPLAKGLEGIQGPSSPAARGPPPRAPWTRSRCTPADPGTTHDPQLCPPP